ncbi:MAG: serine/threonine-protein kinase [bacterium]
MAKFEPKPFGKYFLTDRIAVGGMAEIYKAKTFGVDGFEKVLAIKKILSHCSADIEFITMLTDEAKLVVNLSHANIVQVYDLGRVGDDYFISMEFIDGINLRDLVEKSRELHEPIPIDIAIYIISEVCRGLDYAHSKKGTDGEPLEIIHRDISPQNILVSYDGGVKIVDFGIAKAARNLSQTHAGILKGKVNYMAPEQAFGKPMDKRTDVFSLGNVFYELITCKRLFYGESQMEILKKIRNQKITETTFEDDVPNTIKPLLARALSYTPKKRFDSAADFQIELTKVLYSNYNDFTPRKLIELLNRWFEDRKVEDSDVDDVDVDKETIIVSSTTNDIKQINIVHRDEKIESQLTHQVDVHAETIKPDDSISPDDFDEHIEIAKELVEEVEKTEKSEVTMREDSLEEMLVRHRVEQKAMSYKKATLGIVFIACCFVALVYFLIKKDGINYIKGLFQPQEEITQTQVVVQEKTVLKVYTQPPGAKIWINNSLLGFVTPAELRDLDIGKTYQLKFSLPGFQDVVKTVHVKTKDMANLQVSFVQTNEKIVYNTSIHSTPSEAQIYIDGEDTGFKTPYNLTEFEKGKIYKILLKREGFQDYVTTLKNDSSENQSLNILLLPVPQADLNITSDPAGATIYINGKITKFKTPYVLKKLPIPQTITILLKKDSYQDVTQTLNLEEAKEIALNKIMVKVPTQEKQQKIKNTSVPVTQQQTTPIEQGDTKKVKDNYSAFNTTSTNVALNAKLRIDSSPRGAKVVINGVTRGITPIVVSNLPKNMTVQVQVSKTGYQTWSRTMNLSSDRTEINAVLGR